MGIVIGIDVGISTTKIVGVRDMQVISPMRITAADPVTSLYGAFGKYLYENHVDLSDVEQVVLTGVGSAWAPALRWCCVMATTSAISAVSVWVAAHWPASPASCSRHPTSNRWQNWPKRVISPTST